MQNKLLGSNSGASLMEEWDLTTPGQDGEDIENWSRYCKSIEGASFIRFSLACECEAYFALGETEEAKPKRITWYFAGYGNHINAPHWVEGHDYDYGDPDSEYAYREEPSLLGEDTPRWFEVNWSVEGKEGMIEVSSIKNEEGEGKKVWSTFPIKGHSLNYFMPVTGYNQRGIWKIKIYEGVDPPKDEGEDEVEKNAESEQEEEKNSESEQEEEKADTRENEPDSDDPASGHRHRLKYGLYTEPDQPDSPRYSEEGMYEE